MLLWVAHKQLFTITQLNFELSLKKDVVVGYMYEFQTAHVSLSTNDYLFACF